MEQNDWLYKSEVPGIILEQMAKATDLDVTNVDRRGEMMSGGAIYFQQLAKNSLCDHFPNMGIWWSRGITIGIEIFIF